METRKLPLQNLSTAAKVGLILLVGIIVYAISFLAAITAIPASILVSALIVYLFWPVLGRQHLVKTACVAGIALFLILSSLGSFGTRQDFVTGCRQGWAAGKAR